MARTNAECQERFRKCPPNVWEPRWTSVPSSTARGDPNRDKRDEKEGAMTEGVLTFIKSLSRLRSPARLECRLADAIHRHLKRLSTGSPDDKPAPTASNSGSVHPRAYIRLHLHLSEHDVGPVCPVLARGWVRQAFRHAHYITCDRVQHARPDGGCVARFEDS